MSAFPTRAPRTTNVFDAHDGLQAVLWDMDGTIVDTEPYWIAAEKELVHRHGGTWSDEEAQALIGQALPTSAAILRQAGVDLEIREIIDEMTASVVRGLSENMVFRPGARELLGDLRAHGVPCALVTMSEGPMAQLVADSLPSGTFEFLITGDMVPAGKPDPAPYLLALERMGQHVTSLQRHRAVAIEDSDPGVRSAAASGTPTVAVPHFSTLPETGNWTVWPTLDGVTAGDLDSFVAPAGDAG
ncbi:HAD family hydrolase [Arthrobacter rhombi]|uniref:HAD-superfamily hydrolase, subfamily IA, variant 3 n=1 Tax=Arthrobacter rhombi TaxID=71253 RepID=A0A1R4GWF1_9MICC|nr:MULTISPECIES: HAD family hydrolase [Micrococcaceae]PCC26924.1 haloacid dehalogenase [Glutamicibacter sp. BW78]SJM72434.1 HAD-superfamily hydrolase, subfamily IA, variant 3 [Arthrobacter rhombi]